MSLFEIETARLRLRPYTWNDLDDLHRIWNDPLVRRYLWDDQPVSPERAESVLTDSIECFGNHGFGFWTVWSKERNIVIGFCGLRFINDTSADVELLYGLFPQYWGQGLATEVARAMLRYGFEECGLARIYAGADPPNTASFRVMEKAGMTVAKRMRTNNLDTLYYAVSRDEFQPEASTYILRRI